MNKTYSENHGQNGVARLYAATTLEYFLEPFSHDLGRYALARVMEQDGVKFRWVDAEYLSQLRGLVRRAQVAAQLAPHTLVTIQKRWNVLQSIYASLLPTTDASPSPHRRPILDP